MNKSDITRSNEIVVIGPVSQQHGRSVQLFKKASDSHEYKSLRAELEGKYFYDFNPLLYSPYLNRFEWTAFYPGYYRTLSELREKLKLKPYNPKEFKEEFKKWKNRWDRNQKNLTFKITTKTPMESVVEDSEGTKKWYKDGVLHRGDDLPAIIWAQGTKEWYNFGHLHRTGDLPAIEARDGSKYWYKYGDLHRENGLPAIEEIKGTKIWYEYGKKHRSNGMPAVEVSNGTKKWFKRGELHRKGGLPAIEWSNGKREWYKNGIPYRKGGLPVVELRCMVGMPPESNQN